jgi:Uma2 family endonuclease
MHARCRLLIAAATNKAPQKMSRHTFLAWEDEQKNRHEFVCGEVFAMVGSRRVHAQGVGNVFASLKGQRRGKPCRPFAVTAKRLKAGDDLLYPDLLGSKMLALCRSG